MDKIPGLCGYQHTNQSIYPWPYKQHIEFPMEKCAFFRQSRSTNKWLSVHVCVCVCGVAVISFACWYDKLVDNNRT